MATESIMQMQPICMARFFAGGSGTATWGCWDRSAIAGSFLERGKTERGAGL